MSSTSMGSEKYIKISKFQKNCLNQVNHLRAPQVLHFIGLASQGSYFRKIGQVRKDCPRRWVPKSISKFQKNCSNQVNHLRAPQVLRFIGLASQHEKFRKVRLSQKRPSSSMGSEKYIKNERQVRSRNVIHVDGFQKIVPSSAAQNFCISNNQI